MGVRASIPDHMESTRGKAALCARWIDAARWWIDRAPARALDVEAAPLDRSARAGCTVQGARGEGGGGGRWPAAPAKLSPFIQERVQDIGTISMPMGDAMVVGIDSCILNCTHTGTHTLTVKS